MQPRSSILAIALAGNGGTGGAPPGAVAGVAAAEPSTGAGGTGGGRLPENKAARAKTAGRAVNGAVPTKPAGDDDARPGRIGGEDAVVVNGGGRAGDGVAGRALVEVRGSSGRGRFRDSRWRSNGEGLGSTVAGGVERAEAEGEGEPRAAWRRRRRAAERAAGGIRRSASLAGMREARAASRDSAA